MVQENLQCEEQQSYTSLGNWNTTVCTCKEDHMWRIYGQKRFRNFRDFRVLDLAL